MHPVVTTQYGTVRGSLAGGVHSFKGIPYAAPPFGANRLRPPQPVEPWSGVRDALTYGPKQPQPPYPKGFEAFPPELAVPGEDCLNLNIWSPDLGAARLPVMVWIHGGAFELGTAATACYDGSHFARDGIVCVTGSSACLCSTWPTPTRRLPRPPTCTSSLGHRRCSTDAWARSMRWRFPSSSTCWAKELSCFGVLTRRNSSPIRCTRPGLTSRPEEILVGRGTTCGSGQPCASTVYRRSWTILDPLCGSCGKACGSRCQTAASAGEPCLSRSTESAS